MESIRGRKQFIAECVNLPVVPQRETADELVMNLKESISLELEGEYLKDFGLAEEPSLPASLELETDYANA